jgi:hypothetical protein
MILNNRQRESKLNIQLQNEIKLPFYHQVIAVKEGLFR